MESFFFAHTIMKATIKSWSANDRPREKMIEYGCKTLSTSELLAILINTGSCKKTAVDLARELLDSADNRLDNLSSFSLEKLQSISGIGMAKAVSIQACFELGRRAAGESPQNSPVIRSSEQIAKLMGPLLDDLPYEECWVIYLNKMNKITGKERVSIGGTDQTTLDIRIIAKKAVEKLAHSVILVHNHPSGNRFPSRSDIEQTKSLRSALDVFNIALLDHVIISCKKYFSFSDENY